MSLLRSLRLVRESVYEAVFFKYQRTKIKLSNGCRFLRPNRAAMKFMTAEAKPSRMEEALAIRIVDESMIKLLEGSSIFVTSKNSGTFEASHLKKNLSWTLMSWMLHSKPVGIPSAIPTRNRRKGLQKTESRES